MILEENDQLILKINENNLYSTDDYIISDSNINAYQDCLVEGNIGLNPFKNILIIKGPKFSGKSFLAYIISLKRNAKIINAAEDLITHFKEYNEFIFDFNSQSPAEDDVIFHLINAAKDNDKNLFLFLPDEFSTLLPDLKSRISSIKTTFIKEADENMIEIFMSSYFSKKSIEPRRDIIDFLKNRLDRKFDIISNFLDGLDLYCLKHKKNLTIKSTSEYLKLFEENNN